MTAVAVVGDIFYDCVCDLKGDLPPDLLGHDVHLLEAVRGVVGGGGTQFALAAARLGFGPVTVIGKVGGRTAAEPDPEAAAALAAMSAAGVVAALAFDPDHGTGRAMITYLPGDIRFMVSDRGANAAFDQCDLTGAMLEAAATARLLYVSGYSLIEPARRAAVGRLIDAARTGGATVALDVVPHEFDAFMPRAAIEDLLKAVDWILLEVPTGRRLAGLPPGATLDDVLAALLDHTPSVALFPHPSRAVIGHRGARCERSFDYTPGAASRGQSARAQAELLFEFLGAVGGP